MDPYLRTAHSGPQSSAIVIQGGLPNKRTNGIMVLSLDYWERSSIRIMGKEYKTISFNTCPSFTISDKDFSHISAMLHYTEKEGVVAAYSKQWVEFIRSLAPRVSKHIREMAFIPTFASSSSSSAPSSAERSQATSYAGAAQVPHVQQQHCWIPASTAG